MTPSPSLRRSANHERTAADGTKPACSITQQKVYVYNGTDGVLAWPSPMTLEDARAFIREFPKRFARQGHYTTATGERIKPVDVELTLLDENWEPVQG